MLSILFFTTLLVLTGCQQNNSQNTKISANTLEKGTNKTTIFLRRIKQLQDARTDSIILKSNGKIKINPLEKNLSEITFEETEKGEIILGEYKPLTKADILKITGKYILVFLHNKHSDELRAATFSHEGKPIETVLLFYHFGNNEFKISRAYSYNNEIPYSYDSLKNKFTFTDLRYDTKWIEFPENGKDTLTYKINFTIQVNENGRFKKISKK